MVGDAPVLVELSPSVALGVRPYGLQIKDRLGKLTGMFTVEVNELARLLADLISMPDNKRPTSWNA
jgi:hypothetical protein